MAEFQAKYKNESSGFQCFLNSIFAIKIHFLISFDDIFHVEQIHSL